MIFVLKYDKHTAIIVNIANRKYRSLKNEAICVFFAYPLLYLMSIGIETKRSKSAYKLYQRS